MDKQKTSMPIIAGILLIVEAGFKLLVLLGTLGVSIFMIAPMSFPINTVALIPIVMVPLLAWAVLALVGGIFALQRKRWGLALAGAIVAILPFSLLGMAALILIILSKNEFE
ncbi:hypothetical protein ACFLVJ_01430 [Chloroflexota bacterium]